MPGAPTCDDEPVNQDQFGEPVSATSSATVVAWDVAFSQVLDFVGDPIGSLVDVNANDEAFVIGPVFSAGSYLLGGWSPSHPVVTVDVQRAARRANKPHDVGHAEALALLVAGEFGQAAARWDALAVEHRRDLLAIKMAHDLYLHNGDAEARLRSSQAAIDGWQPGERGYGIVAGQLAFAYEELGHYVDAERWGRIALDITPGDMWARHALTHVYESQSRHTDLVSLLCDADDDWSQRTLFATHLWWHYGLRLLANGETAAAIDVLDRYLASATAFGLCDSTSLVWRMELAGLDVGDRWRRLAEQWSTIKERHNSAFVDVHGAMAFAAVGGAEADRFWDGLGASHIDDRSENGVTFNEVVKPLAAYLRAYRNGDRQRAAAGMHAIEPSLHRIGGSVIQRNIIAATVRRISSQGEEGGR